MLTDTNIDNIRAKAYRAASARGDEGTSNYNPFARVRSRESTDIEKQNHRTQSEPRVQPTIEEQQRLESERTEKELSAPAFAPTSDGIANGPRSVIDKDTTTLNAGTSKESADISDNTIIVGSDHSGATKRAKFKQIFRKSHDGEGAGEVTRQETDGLSFEERKRRAHKRKIPVGAQFRAAVFSWINILLIFVPLGFAFEYGHVSSSPWPVFIVNFIAIIPLAGTLSYATEELALRVGETMGGLLNASFGNAVELIVSIQALIKNEIIIVKTSLIGSMLSNLLLVLGMSFYFGGINRTEQFFNVTVAQTAASLLALCIGSLIIPTVFHTALIEDQTDGTTTDNKKNQGLSRGTAIILLFVYACYLVFQLRSHADMYNAPSQKVAKKKSSRKEEGDAFRGIAAIGAGTAAASGGMINENKLVKEEAEEEEDEVEEPSLSVWGAVITLTISTVLVAFCSEFMVSAIDGITGPGSALGKTFVGLILLPIVGNAAEHATAVTVAIKDKMDLAIGVAVGSSMQIALLVLPLVVILGWITGHDCMTLYFDNFQIVVLFVAILLVNYLIQDGKSHWLEGMLLMCTYVIIALAAWFYPNPNEDSQC
ncbi:calcium/proton exchanger [Pleomassaria siparia CBS 279.74]|uniref:Calcium/proton exchanger n=1 Tax=Pleomassaria siparia CBS 279.74 TaxID=1314801 RepID=A0A6G1K815_9PLEO|nr:calcium/proton exchanger [Pleomassaria siparia CBS 279.74]